MNTKDLLRIQLREKRSQISKRRREDAEEAIFKKIVGKVEGFMNILSFVSKKDEINTYPVNQFLAKDKRLFLPRIEGDELCPYRVNDISSDLELNKKWNIHEPIPSRCKKVSPFIIDCILVPGLGFDKINHRLGYGKGHFDRFLAKMNCTTYGIGYKEQFLEELLPIEPHDILLTEIILA